MKTGSKSKIQSRKPVVRVVLITVCLLAVNVKGKAGGGWDKPAFGDRIIVQFAENPPRELIEKTTQKYNIRVRTITGIKRFFEEKHSLKNAGAHLENVPFTVYRVPDPSKLEMIVDEFSELPVVVFAQPDYKRYALAPVPPDDTYYVLNQQWGFEKIQAREAMVQNLIDPAKDRQVVVAVLDTGVGVSPDCDHADLRNVTVTGKNILNPPVQPYDDETDGGHGTNAAGIIAAETNNSMGVAGTAYMHSSWTARVYIMPVKVLDSGGEGVDSDIYSGIKWAVDNGAKVINCSFGGPDGGDVLQNAMNYAYERGCINVAAAGNSDADTFYPAAFSNVISVASTDQNDIRSAFSNYGKIDLSAPGESIISTGNNSETAYSTFDGTSFAAPFVSGLAALLWIKFDNATNDEIRKIMEQSAHDAGAPGYDQYTGWGRIDAVNALKKQYSPVDENITTYNWPNPFSPDRDIYTNIVFVLKMVTDTDIEIYDGSGSLVWKTHLAESAVEEGFNSVKWDGTNMNGKKAGSGVYFYLIKTPQIYGKNKIAVLY